MSAVGVETYLTFGGRCEEALAFYREAVGAEVVRSMRFRDCPDPLPPGMVPPGYEDKIMHAAFRVGGTTLLASDGMKPGVTYSGFSLSLGVASEAEADRAFAALSEGGTVTMPLTTTFWSPKFGMLRDRFGVEWMVNVAILPMA